MKNYVSIDIGGTAIKYGIINEKGQIIEKKQIPTEAFLGGPGILEKVFCIIETYLEEYHPEGICISTAGMVDTKAGTIFYAAPLIPNYAGTCFKEVLESQFSIPCEVENDVNCAGLCESKAGAGRGRQSMLCLTVGTGIGGCIVVDGKVFHGFSNSACEIGYMHMDGSDFQTLGASSILTKKVAQKKCEDSALWSGRRIFEAAQKGDDICRQAIDEMVDVLGKGIANICYVLNPEIVVLGGGIMAQESYLKGKIESALAAYLIPSVAACTTVAFAEHKNDAGMLGAFYNFQIQQGMRV